MPHGRAPARGLTPDMLVSGGQGQGSEVYMPFPWPGKASNEKANDLFLPSLQKGWDNLDFTRMPLGLGSKTTIMA